MQSPRTISILATPGVQLTDVAGPLDVFAAANTEAGQDAYQLEVVGTTPGPVRSSSGVRLVADRVLDAPGAESSHTFLVAGMPTMPGFRPPKLLLPRIRAEAERARRYGSVCSGAFLLAAAGLLDGRRVTTHWALADRLAIDYPALTVDRDALYVRDGPVRTSAGVTAGMDMALSLVEEDLGRDVALRVSQQLVMFFKRPGGQLQFSRGGAAAPAGRSALQELQRWVAANPSEDHSVPHLARRLGLSPRHFARLFAAETGITPASWVEAARIEAARALLETADHVPKQVAARCGFADVNVLRRAFQRHVGITPSEYRKRFQRGR